MCDFQTASCSTNPYYCDIFAYLLSKEQLIIRDLTPHLSMLFKIQTRIKIKLSTLYFAKSLFIRSQFTHTHHLLAALWIALKYDHSDKISFDHFQAITAIPNLSDLENAILSSIDFQLHQPTVTDFLDLLIQFHRAQLTHDQIHLLQVLALLVFPLSVPYQPSTIASSLLVSQQPHPQLISFDLLAKPLPTEDSFQTETVRSCCADLRALLIQKHNHNILAYQRFPHSMKLIKRNLNKLF